MQQCTKGSDGSLVNVEIQRHGYYFPLERSFCYGADLLVRQYAHLRDELGKDFSYKRMRPVCVIVLMENSPSEFHAYPNTFLHRSHFGFNSGLDLNNLLNFIYIPLDIFCQMPHNDIGELEAWLYFLGSDNPLHIQRIIEKYPFFKEYYQEIINFRYQPKELITMFSEALAIMDKNTINLMIDDMKMQVQELNEIIMEKDSALAEKDNALAEKDNIIAEMATQIARLEAEKK